MLSFCTSSYGGTHILDGEPSLYEGRDLLFVPFGDHRPGGIYDRSGRPITEGALLRGVPALHFADEGVGFSDLVTSRVHSVSDHTPHFYMGRAQGHFGHFLLSTLSRFWPFTRHRPKSFKILFSDPEFKKSVLEKPYIMTLLRALNLDASDMISYEEPTVIRHCIVSSPSFIENYGAYSAFGDLCRLVGDKISHSGDGRDLSDFPLYITKEKLHCGVTRLTNENQFTRILSDKGVRVISIEELELIDQISLFRNHKKIAGMIASAFHLTAFSPPQDILILNYEAKVWSNQIIVDKINQNRSNYIYDQKVIDNGGGDGFLNNFSYADPIETAELILDFFESRRFNHVLRQIVEYQSIDVRYQVDMPFGRILSRLKPCTQSSISKWSRSNDLSSDAARAVSGLFSGTYNFHTEKERGFWQVDLLEIYNLTGFIIYNRGDGNDSAANNISILTSVDGAIWEERATFDSEFPFGGARGVPWKVILPICVTARLVRIQQNIEQYLHLEQVEVFGFDCDRPVAR